MPSLWAKDMEHRIMHAFTLMPRHKFLKVVCQLPIGWPFWGSTDVRDAEHRVCFFFPSKLRTVAYPAWLLLFFHTHYEIAHGNTHGRSPGKIITEESVSKKAALVHEPSVSFTHLPREKKKERWRPVRSPTAFHVVIGPRWCAQAHRRVPEPAWNVARNRWSYYFDTQYF